MPFKNLKLSKLFCIDTSDAILMQAHLKTLSNQIPLLYFVLSVNVTALAYGFYGLAPEALTLYAPFVLNVLSIYRLSIWLSRLHNQHIFDPATIGRHLQATVILGSILAAAFVGWALSLYPYGDSNARFQVLYFVGITTISCVFCMMNLRAAALSITLIVIPVFTLFLISSGNQSFVAIGLNLAIVSIAMVHVMFNYSSDFVRMVRSQAETQRLSDENLRLANIDSLTGLPNRRQFFARLDSTLTQRKSADVCALGIIDLDGFKPVNDLHGHVLGDLLLIEASRRLAAFSNANIFIARLGGDEFGIIISKGGDKQDVLLLGDRICELLAVPFELPNVIAKISASCGFAIQRDEDETSQALYERADFALYQAKHHTFGRPTLFSEEHQSVMRQTSLIEQKLKSCDLETEMTLQFQPMFDVCTGKPVSFEALARWHNADIGVVAPDVFIAIAERTNLIHSITRILLKKALAVAATWPANVRLSFNLSMRDIICPTATLQIVSIIHNSGFDPRRLDLEVTETALLTDFEKAREALVCFKRMGVCISLDDFGTGYCSLSYVHQLPLDKIKIDRSFVQSIETPGVGRDIVKTVINLCHNLSLACVTEGVETAGQKRILVELGCTIMQGYYFARPLSASQAADLLADFSDRGMANVG